MNPADERSILRQVVQRLKHGIGPALQEDGGFAVARARFAQRRGEIDSDGETGEEPTIGLDCAFFYCAAGGPS
jgi:hypothetical protein